MNKRFLVTLTAGFGEQKYSFMRKFQFTTPEWQSFYDKIIRKQNWLLGQSEVIDKGMITLDIIDNNKEEEFRFPRVFLLSRNEIFEIINA